MFTPRPDHYTYPHGTPGDQLGHRYSKVGEIAFKKPWMRAVFVAALLAAFALGLALTLGG